MTRGNLSCPSALERPLTMSRSSCFWSAVKNWAIFGLVTFQLLSTCRRCLCAQGSTTSFRCASLRLLWKALTRASGESSGREVATAAAAVESMKSRRVRSAMSFSSGYADGDRGAVQQLPVLPGPPALQDRVRGGLDLAFEELLALHGYLNGLGEIDVRLVQEERDLLRARGREVDRLALDRGLHLGGGRAF